MRGRRMWFSKSGLDLWGMWTWAHWLIQLGPVGGLVLFDGRHDEGNQLVPEAETVQPRTLHLLGHGTRALVLPVGLEFPRVQIVTLVEHLLVRRAQTLRGAQLHDLRRPGRIRHLLNLWRTDFLWRILEEKWGGKKRVDEKLTNLHAEKHDAGEKIDRRFQILQSGRTRGRKIFLQRNNILRMKFSNRLQKLEKEKFLELKKMKIF